MTYGGLRAKTIPDSEAKTSKMNTCEGLGSKDLRIMKALEAKTLEMKT